MRFDRKWTVKRTVNLEPKRTLARSPRRRSHLFPATSRHHQHITAQAPPGLTTGAAAQVRAGNPQVAVPLAAGQGVSRGGLSNLEIEPHMVRTTRNFASPLSCAHTLARLFKRIGFDHRGHAGQFGKVQRVPGISQRSGRPPFNPEYGRWAVRALLQWA